MTLLDPTIDTINVPAAQIQVGDIIHRRHRWRVMARNYDGRHKIVALRCHREGEPARNQTISLHADVHCHVERARRLVEGECRWCAAMNTDDSECWKCGR